MYGSGIFKVGAGSRSLSSGGTRSGSTAAAAGLMFGAGAREKRT